MKKLSVLLVCCCVAFSLSAQQLFFETFSGYNLTAYDLEGFDESEYFIPIGFRLAGGFEHVQFGGEYHTDIVSPAFKIQDAAGNDIQKTEFKNTYYGGLIRANISSLPAYRFGLVLKAGAGMYKTERSVFLLPGDEQQGSTVSYDPSFGFNGGIGISAPIHSILHWELGYMYHHINWQDQGLLGLVDYKGSYHSFQLGLSLNLVFGNTAKACKRVIREDSRMR